MGPGWTNIKRRLRGSKFVNSQNRFDWQLLCCLTAWLAHSILPFSLFYINTNSKGSRISLTYLIPWVPHFCQKQTLNDVASCAALFKKASFCWLIEFFWCLWFWEARSSAQVHQLVPAKMHGLVKSFFITLETKTNRKTGTTAFRLSATPGVCEFTFAGSKLVFETLLNHFSMSQTPNVS